MEPRVANYIHRSKFYVEGWLRTEAALTIAALNERQHELGIQGGVAEIGVHHGKLFILLYLLSRSPEKAVAIDLFEEQHLNVDLSGRGDLAKFRHHLNRYADDTRLVLHQGNSMDLTAASLMQLAGGPLRFISVDGGHTADITAHDLAVAEASLCEDGIIVLDDAFNERWPGVSDGVHRYFSKPSSLVPIAIGAGKTYFCRPSCREVYGRVVASVSSTITTTQFLNETVAFQHFVRPSLTDRIVGPVVHSAAWRRIRTTSVGLPLRWLWRTGRTLRRGVLRREDF